MIGLPTATTSRMSETSMPASPATSCASALTASRTLAVISLSPPGFIMT
jgi:hypothetical protein